MTSCAARLVTISCLSLQDGKRNRNPVSSGERKHQGSTQAICEEKFNVLIDVSQKDLYHFTKQVVAFTDIKQIASTKGLGQEWLNFVIREILLKL